MDHQVTITEKNGSVHANFDQILITEKNGFICVIFPQVGTLEKHKSDHAICNQDYITVKNRCYFVFNVQVYMIRSNCVLYDQEVKTTKKTDLITQFATKAALQKINELTAFCIFKMEPRKKNNGFNHAI